MRRMIVAALALAGVFLALYLTLYKLGAIGQLACTVGSCERVNTSRWATFLGAPVAAWGVAFYATVFIVAFVGTMPANARRRGVSVALTGMSLTGVLFSAWLTWLELFVIHAICQYCVASAMLVTLIFLISASDLVNFWMRRSGRNAVGDQGRSGVSAPNA